MLGRGFEAEGFCVVRGPDIVWGGDVREFHPPSGAFAGVIGGSPCQDFSKARRTEPTGAGVELLREYARVVEEASPEWFLLENVPGVPDIDASGYTVQRFNLNAAECGGRQSRLRTFQFGSRDGTCLVIDRRDMPDDVERTCMATEFWFFAIFSSSAAACHALWHSARADAGAASQAAKRRRRPHAASASNDRGGRWP
ncbi:DNA cytosine methyltransferase [Termitidicoccus mucosus]|uniref:Uncharacterized protein n=1 Tax=Termitidicoccus mucosus TaxID=1184151 RepID=A0A178IC30_9BACT|nr:hypothetical protein AW736_21895 [Opitutaceae bacterium TSB47]